MADTNYPRNLISRRGWKKGIEAVDIINNCSDAIIGHWIEGTYESCIDLTLGPGMERLKEESLPNKSVPNLSCSLLGALYLYEHFKYLPANDGKKLWDENTDVPDEMVSPDNYTILAKYFVVGWLIRNVHFYHIEYPHGFSKKKEYDAFKNKAEGVAEKRNIDAAYLKEWEELKFAVGSDKLRIAKLKGEARVNHNPTNLNFWHFTIDSYPAEDDVKAIANASDGWRYNMAANLADYLRRSFKYIEDSTDIPQISDSSLWEI